MQIKDKLTVLAKIGRALNAEGITWAVGASLLLYFKGLVDNFHDIDIVMAEQDVLRARAVLDGMGTVERRMPDDSYRTRMFLEYNIDGVEMDVMAGFAILDKDGVEHYFPLRREDIQEHTQVHGVDIPLQRLQAWQEYYGLMGRDAKVTLIADWLASHKN